MIQHKALNAIRRLLKHISQHELKAISGEVCARAEVKGHTESECR